MADTRVEMNLGPDWAAFIAAGNRRVLEQIAPQMLDVQRRGVPVDTARLQGSLDSRVVETPVGPELQVGSLISPDNPDGVEYCLAVEFGFHGLEQVSAHTRNGRPVRAHTRQGNSPEQPYLRPSAYRRYTP